MDPRVEIVHFLDDIGEPYSCTQWGNIGTEYIPPIVDDGFAYTVRDWFPSEGALAFPLTIFINHKMEIVDIYNATLSFDDTNSIIECMLNEMDE